MISARGKRPGASTTGGVFTALILASCSSPSGVAEPGPEPSQAVFGDFGENGVSADADRATMSISDEGFVTGAFNESLRRCMEDEGLPFHRMVVGFDPLSRAGPLSPNVLRAEGYVRFVNNPPSDLPILGAGGASVKLSANERAVSALSSTEQTRWYTTMYGGDASGKLELALPDGDTVSFSTEGCFSRAASEIFGSLQNYANYEAGAYFLRSNIRRELHLDLTFQTTYEDWRACMMIAGFSLQPLDIDETADSSALYATALADELFSDLPSIEAMERQNVLADADANCQEEVGMDSVVESAVQEILEDSAEQYAYDLLGRREMLQDAVVRSKEMLGAAP